MPNLIAVFASPFGSHTIPNRGLRSFQFGTFLMAGNDCGRHQRALGHRRRRHGFAEPVEAQTRADRDAAQPPLILHEQREVGAELVDLQVRRHELGEAGRSPLRNV